jgi:hypothetical protein
MNTAEIMKAVLEALMSTTGSSGSPTDANDISNFLPDPANATDDIFFSVAGIPMSHFFAMSNQGFEDMKDQLWRSIQDAVTAPDLAQPTNLDVSTTVGQLTVFIHAKLS